MVMNSKQKESLLKFPRKGKGKFEKTAARSMDRYKYRKDFKKQTHVN